MNFKRVLSRPLLLALSLSLAPSAFLGGCEGGTSSTAENPGLVVGFRRGGEPVDFRGPAMVYAAGANPEFYAPAPVGKVEPRVEISFGNGFTNTLYMATARKVQILDGNVLSEAAGYRLSLPLLPPSMEGENFNYIALPGERGLDKPFNVVFRNHLDTTLGYVEGLVLDSTGRYRGPDGELKDTIWVDLDRAVSISGSLDTAGAKDAPLMLFAPGLPFAARIHGDRFRLSEFPRAKMAMRIVNAAGEVLALRDTVDLTKVGDPNFGDTLPTAVPGDKQGKVDLPATPRMLDAPQATPEGPHSFTDSVKVVLSAESGASVHYTLDGTTPGLHSTRYTGPVTLRASATLKAVAYKDGTYPSPVAIHTYLLVPPSPKANPASKAFRDSLVVSLTAGTKGGTVYYTTDGSTPHAGSPLYTSPLTFRATTILRAVTSVPGLGLSGVVEERYILVTDSLPSE